MAKGGRKKLLKTNHLVLGKMLLFIEDNDKLLQVRTSGYEEEMTRLFFEDIAYMSVTRRNDVAAFLLYLIISGFLGLIAIIIVVFGSFNIAFTTFALLSAILLLKGINDGFIRKQTLFRFQGNNPNLKIDFGANLSPKKRESTVSLLQDTIYRHQQRLQMEAPE